MPSLLISIDRTSLSLPPLVLSASDDANPLGISAFQQPGKVARVQYMPDAANVDGSEAIGFSWQQGLISFDTFPDADNETTAQALIAELEAAVGQFSYSVTTTVNDAPARTWSADPGSVVPDGGRTLDDLTAFNPTYVVTIPVYPIAS